MANELMGLRVSQDIPAKDMVDVVRTIYPRFDKPLLSKCQHHELYGIDLRDDAMAALRQRYPAPTVATPTEEAQATDAAQSPKRDTHRLSCRISCRLEDDEYEALRRYVRADGYDTMQAWLAHTVRRYIKRRADKEAGNV